MIGTPRTRATAGVIALVAVVGVIVLTNDSGDDPAPVAADSGSTDSDADADGDTDSPDTEDAETDSSGTAVTVTEPLDVPDLPDRGLHSDLISIDGWLQSDVTSLEELRGSVVAVQFWTFGCSNCKATLPHMQALYEKYQADGLEIVGIHAPEFDYEADVDNIAEAAANLGVTWPIALDPDKRTFHSWQEGPTAFWPRIYLLDRDGHIRYDHTGEGAYDDIDAAVGTLLAEQK